MSASLFGLWMDTVGRSPSAAAVVEAPSGKAWSRGALAKSASEWADSFARAPGRSPLAGRRVAMCVANGADWLQVFLGLISCGAIPAPIDPSEPEMAQADAALSIGAPWIWRAGRLHRVAPPDAPGPGRRRGPAECLVKLTSGSTGAPRGLPVTHAQIEADGRQICASMGILPGDANLASIPLGYSYGLGNLVAPLIIQGTRIICASSPLPHALASDARTHGATVFPTVPPVLGALVASDVAPESFAGVRLVISAGSPLSPEVSRAFAGKFGVRVHGFYGTSETGGIAFDRTGRATLAGRSVGTPIANVGIAFGPGGRFTVSSPAVLGRGRFSPADRGRLNGNGELVLLGRTDRVVKIGGRRVDLAEIESALRAVPGVRDAFAHLTSGARLTAAVSADAGAADIRAHLRARLAAWKVPSRIIALPQFPATARGKTDTRKLRQVLSSPRSATSISTFSAARQISAPR